MEHIVNAAYTAAAGRRVTGKQTGLPRKATRARQDLVSKNEKTPFDAILTIISSESGIALGELADELNFDDLGVDSLLSLLIISRIREELDIDLDNSIFLDLKNLGALRLHVNGLCLSSRPDEHVATIEPTRMAADTVWLLILDIISQETRCPLSDLSDDSNLADLGVDSLLSLIISSRLQEELDIDLPHVSLFVDCDTIGCLRERISERPKPSAGDISNADSGSGSSWSPVDVPSLETPPSPQDTPSNAELCEKEADSLIARSHIVQGSVKTAAYRLFLFPDGGGSSMSYTKIPLISPAWAVIAFDSPFLRFVQLLYDPGTRH